MPWINYRDAACDEYDRLAIIDTEVEAPMPQAPAMRFDPCCERPAAILKRLRRQDMLGVLICGIPGCGILCFASSNDWLSARTPSAASLGVDRMRIDCRAPGAPISPKLAAGAGRPEGLPSPGAGE
jgi:hypothetical protein